MTADALFAVGAIVLTTFNTIAIIDTRARVARMIAGPRR